MKWIALTVAVAAIGCSSPAWVASPPATDSESASEGLLRVWRQAAEDREARFAEAMHPGSAQVARAKRLSDGNLDDFRAEGERLFALDAPWSSDAPPPISPAHVKGAAPTADATRCAGCHHQGGAGGSGAFSDLAFFDAEGDDVLQARRRLPPMLAGAALLERAADGHDELQPFGWAPGRPRSLRAMVRWSVDTHLASAASDDEIDALTLWIAMLPPPAAQPAPHDSLVLRAQHGAELFRTIGCAECHLERLPVENPLLALSSGRTLDLRRLLSRDGAPPYSIAALTDLRPHKMGAALGEGEPGKDDRFVTPPLWGVASRGPWLHDGRAPTVAEAILAHGGEAEKARKAYQALDSQTDLLLYLETLGRAPVMGWVR
jgi:mono/diheme cytochrome c family protein